MLEKQEINRIKETKIYLYKGSDLNQVVAFLLLIRVLLTRELSNNLRLKIKIYYQIKGNQSDFINSEYNILEGK